MQDVFMLTQMSFVTGIYSFNKYLNMCVTSTLLNYINKHWNRLCADFVCLYLQFKFYSDSHF